MLQLWITLNLCFLISSVSHSARAPLSREIFFLALAAALLVVLPFGLYLAGESVLGVGLVVASLVAHAVFCCTVGKLVPISLPQFKTATAISLPWRIAWTLGFFAVIAGGASFELLERDFATSGPRLLVFNLSRVGFIVYLAFALFQLGAVVCGIGKSRDRPVNPIAEWGGLERTILFLMTGASVATTLLFFLGLANGYYFLVMLALMTPLVWGSASWIPRFLWVALDQCRRLIDLPKPSQYLPLILTLVMVTLGFVLTIIVKGLWPGGAGGDVYTHYLPYYREVVANHGLAPNDIWYHFYVSKGASLFYLAMVLVDGLGGQLVTMLFHFVSAALVFSLGKRLFRSAIGGSIAAALFLFAFVPAVHWGIFLKHHEMLLTWTLFAIWLACEVTGLLRRNKRELAIAGSAFGIAYALQFPTACALITPFLGVAALWSFFHRQIVSAAILLGTAAVTGFSLIGIIVLNQAITGMGMETPIRLFWKFADKEQFCQWVSPYLMAYLDEGSSAGVGEIVSPLARLVDLQRFSEIFRLQELGVLFFSPIFFFVAGVILVVAWMILQNSRIHHKNSLFLIVAFGVLAWIMANLVNQPVSIYRMFTFLVPVSILIGLLVWISFLRFARVNLLPTLMGKRITTTVLVFTLASFAATSMLHTVRPKIRPKIAFAVGLKSARHALSIAMEGTTGDVWEPYLKAREVVGMEKKILCLNIDGEKIGTSFAFPGPGMESEVSFSLGPRWHVIAFGSPDASEAALRKQGIDYFMIDTGGLWLFGGVPFSQLFERSSLEQRLGMVLKQDGAWLLTWKDQAERPLTNEELVLWELVRSGAAGVCSAQSLKMRMREAVDQIPPESQTPEALTRSCEDAIKAELQLTPTAMKVLTADLSNEVLTTMTEENGLHDEEKQKAFINRVLKSAERNAVDYVDLQMGWTAEMQGDQNEHTEYLLKTRREAVVGEGENVLRMRDLFDVVSEIYRYNKGSVHDVKRPEGLRKARGWQ